MRLSFMTFACPQWTWPEVVRNAAELGYDGIEPRTDAEHLHGLEIGLDRHGRAEARKRAADAGVELCCLATSLQFIKMDAESRRVLLDDARRRVELAVDLGIPGLRVFAGPVPEGQTLSAALEAAGDNLRIVGASAQDAGAELWLETHDTVCKAALAAKIVERANHPAVHFNYDMMHPLRQGETLDETFAALGERIRHTHFHDGLLEPGRATITRFGEGELPVSEILARLKATGYTGYLSGEWFNDQLGPTPRESLEHYLTAMRELVAGA